MKLKAPPRPFAPKRWFRGEPVPYGYPQSQEKPVEITDEQKVLNHGFDLKTSFRTPKKKK